jgi:multiple sugar transport system substrate-binding protein
MRKHYKIFSLLLLAIFVMTSGFGCKGLACKSPEVTKKITLEYWGVWDTPSEINSLIAAYEASHPTIKVNYRNFRYEEYERKLLEAWADDRGPDIMAIPATWLKAYQRRLEPMPATMSIPVLEMQGTIKKEVVTNLKTFAGLTPYDIKERYVPVVSNNVVLDNKVYGLPYYLDTLVTFYNYDLLAQAGIPEPIKDWNDLVAQTPKLSRVTQDNHILQSAVSLGGSTNIPRFFDILSALMLQNEVNLKGNYFNPLADKSGEKFAQALSFYTDFAKPGRASFSWSADLPDALEMFASGKLVYFFGYSYQVANLKNRGLTFDWEITNFPQTRGAAGTKYYTNYWVNVVPKKSQNIAAAWNFIQTTANENQVKEYLQKNKRPTALKSLINEQLKDNGLKVFASQVLTADNWYEGYNIDLAEKYTADLIDELVSGKIILDSRGKNLGLFIDYINKTYAKPAE